MSERIERGFDTIGSAAATDRRRRARLRASVLEHAPLSMLIATAGLYVSTLAVNHSEAEDSATYIHDVTRGSFGDLFHPNHVLFGAFQRLAYVLSTAMGYSGSAEIPMEIVNVISAIASLFLMFRLLRRLSVRTPLALSCVGATALSFGFWWYGVEADTYMLPIPLLLFATDRLLVLATQPRLRFFVELALATALATLFHQQHAVAAIVFGIAVVVMAWRARGGPRFKAYVRGLVAFTGLLGTTVIGAYAFLATRICGARNVPEIIAWARGLAPGGAWTPWSATSPIKSVAGIGRAFTGLHMMFRWDEFREAMQRMWPRKLLLEEIFLVRDTPTPMLVGYVALTAMAVATACALAFIALSRKAQPPIRRACAEERRTFRYVAGGLLLAYAAFNTWWEPQNVEFWVAPLPFFFLLAATRLENVGVGSRELKLAGVFVINLGLSNFFGSVLPQTTHANDYWYEQNRPLIEGARKGDLVLTNGGYISDSYLKLYSRGSVVSVPAVSTEALAKKVRAVGSGRIFVSSWVHEPIASVMASGLARREPDAFAWLQGAGRLHEFARTSSQVVYVLDVTGDRNGEGPHEPMR